ncbi:MULTISPECIES: SpaA isopeptide-forming pilin-related protein [Lacticaseibacillus]|uniref:SpaA isopeptide-forming pilin-related protein n=1 Tax=Lacticaseibacillus TaxID=2759736 RepID=UPI0008A2D317|nr:MULTISPECIES: SpaA isopeptide-forming pilin-related protein [Lacticaseibacillus]MDU5936121.1 SpaA isopeptide-forming pilin-related protein [Lacticaseibacillus rhamnosus]OFQ49191.1 pilus assembly protein [Lactobacillus sp. HMSC073B09]RNE45942.1 putative outer membrane protein [Lacticaseibacillus paracasei]WEB10723.1 SpaA isopeptide-forming pilin-related protein [Lacticaseibacillus rhamnosus]
MTKMTAKVARTGHLFAVLLILMSMLTGLVTSGSSVVTAAANIRPTYQTDANGTYPTNSWQVTGQQNVINQRGGDQVSGWDNNTTWDGDATNTTNSYLKFGDPNNPDYQIRKYAKETNTPGLYDVYLNVKGNTQQNVKPVDIVLVVDMSGSMESNSSGTNRAGAVRTGVKNFLTSIQNAGLGNYVNVGLIGFSSPGYIGGKSGYISVKLGKAGNASQQQAINGALSPRFQGGTYTQIGLRQGSAMLNADASGNKKMMILLTDGVPTFSNEVINSEWINGTLYGTNFGSSRDEPGNTAQLGWPYIDSSGNRIYDTWPATLGEAKKAKDSGNEVHALGIQLADDRKYMTKEKIRQNMQLITNSPDLYEDADSADAVEAYLNNQAKDIIKNFNTVTDGTITDPIGTQFQYANNQTTVTSVGKQAVPASELPSAAIQDGQLTVNHMNLGQDQEVQIHYQVRIKTEDAGFKPDFWYQMNGETLLTPKAGAAAVDFGIPSGRAPATTVYVQKQWRQLSNQSLPDTLNVTVQRKVADGSLDPNWQQTLVLKKADNWKASFTAPAYNNQGQSFSYVVKSEDASGIDLSSFISSQNMDQQTATLTLTNQQYGFQFQKKTTDGTDLSTDQLKAMQFNLTQYSDNSFQQASKTNAITSTDLQALAPGYYSIQEAAAPTGYQLDGTTYLFQLTSDGQWQYHGTKDNVTSGSVINGQQTLNPVGDKSDDFTVTGDHQQILTLTKYDEPKPSMTLRVIKQDNQTQYLAGAAFTLQPSAGEAETITSSATSEGQAFATKLVADGTYTMSETKAPDGYQSNPAKIAIQVATTGKEATVTIDGEALKPGESKNGYTLAIDGSTITLQAINQPLAILPHTGGQGYQRLLGIALGLISAAFLLLLVVLIKRRVVKQHD